MTDLFNSSSSVDPLFEKIMMDHIQRQLALPIEVRSRQIILNLYDHNYPTTTGCVIYELMAALDLLNATSEEDILPRDFSVCFDHSFGDYRGVNLRYLMEDPIAAIIKVQRNFLEIGIPVISVADIEKSTGPLVQTFLKAIEVFRKKGEEVLTSLSELQNICQAIDPKRSDVKLILEKSLRDLGLLMKQIRESKDTYVLAFAAASEIEDLSAEAFLDKFRSLIGTDLNS